MMPLLGRIVVCGLDEELDSVTARLVPDGSDVKVPPCNGRLADGTSDV
jgi:hypothetical protein